MWKKRGTKRPMQNRRRPAKRRGSRSRRSASSAKNRSDAPARRKKENYSKSRRIVTRRN